MHQQFPVLVLNFTPDRKEKDNFPKKLRLGLGGLETEEDLTGPRLGGR